MGTSRASEKIRAKICHLVETQGIKKTKLGEILGKGKKESPQQKFLRASRFLYGEAEIKIDALVKMVHFFDKPLSYFLDDVTDVFLTGLATSEKTKTKKSKSPKEIEKGLRELGFDEKFIAQQVAKFKKK
ncbi:hypothetical protein K9M41_01760 [Candidatus Gracilibacteria bacterium]|nr:hypothetical protein [Candidatus Gracilibacteria bacterium]